MKPFLPMILITLKQYYTIYEFVSGFVLLVVENIGGTECPVSSGEYAYHWHETQVHDGLLVSISFCSALCYHLVNEMERTKDRQLAWQCPTTMIDGNVWSASRCFTP
jgi:hypothetical protein